MIPYYEISEDAGRDPGFFLFRLDNLAGKFMVRESYCVRPGCDCRQVVLQFGEYDDDPAKNRHLVTMPLSLDSWEWVMGKEYLDNMAQNEPPFR